MKQSDWHYGIVLHQGRQRVMFIRWVSDRTAKAPLRPTDKFEGIRIGRGLTAFHPEGDVGLYQSNAWTVVDE